MSYSTLIFLIVCLILGIGLGYIIGRFSILHKIGHGSFRLDEAGDDPEDGLYSVSIAIHPNQDLLKVNKIILSKDHSSK